MPSRAHSWRVVHRVERTDIRQATRDMQTRIPASGLALLLGGSVAFAGYRRHALTASGALASAGIGALTMRAGGARWSGVLLTFFVSSSALSRLESRTEGGRTSEEMTGRGARRDAVQALANGGVAALAATLQVLHPHPVAAAAFAGAFAAANADTWATEIGGLSRTPPRHIVSGAIVPPGTSGGVTPLGLGAAAVGSALVGAASGALTVREHRALRGASVALAGVAGTLVDSLLGATIQAAYRCPYDGAATERAVHRCGNRTEQVRGYRWCTNDAVNVLCTATGALIAATLTQIERWPIHRSSGPSGRRGCQ